MALSIEACLIDLDGTVYEGQRPVEGVADAVDSLRRAGFPFCFTTNTSRKPRSQIVERLKGWGIGVSKDRMFTAPVAAASWLREQGFGRISVLLPEAALEEFGGFEITDVDPEVVLVGDLGWAWTFDRLNTAFRALNEGARLVAIHRNRAWDAGDGLQVDAGAFVAALEYAADCRATLVGKPSTAFFETAAGMLGVPLDHVAVVGDSLETDITGGRAAGCRCILVRTGLGRFAPAVPDPEPDLILTSIAELPQQLGI